jgi:hypothetical protein
VFSHEAGSVVIPGFLAGYHRASSQIVWLSLATVVTANRLSPVYNVFLAVILISISISNPQNR